MGRPSGPLALPVSRRARHERKTVDRNGSGPFVQPLALPPNGIRCRVGSAREQAQETAREAAKAPAEAHEAPERPQVPGDAQTDANPATGASPSTAAPPAPSVDNRTSLERLRDQNRALGLG